MSKRPQLLSPSSVLFTGFPGAFRYVDGCITRVSEISSLEGDRSDQLSMVVRRAIARRIDLELGQVRDHNDEQSRRAAARRGQGTPAVTPADDDFLTDLFGGGQGLAGGVPVMIPAAISGGDVGLIRVDEDARVRTRIYPRSFHCQQCDHYLLIDPGHPPTTLRCPCCESGFLVAEPIVSICAKCASIRELLPPGEPAGQYRRPRRIESYIGSPPDCPDCHQGHIHLLKHQTNSISRWEWECQSCAGFHEPVQERCLECALPAGVNAQAQPSSVIFMQFIPASASNAIVPLTEVHMFVQNTPLDPTTLRAATTVDQQGWADAFDLASATAAGQLHAGDAIALRESCIDDVYLVNRVRAATTTYGYKAGSASNHPVSHVDDGARLARFFEDPERIHRFLCYSMVAEGSALVIELNRRLIFERLSSVSPTMNGQDYESVLQAELQQLRGQPLRDLLRAERGEFLLYRSLHATEHALLTAAIQQIGNEVLGSRIFLARGVIVIFEREPVGRGGVVQLVNRGEGLRRLLIATRDHVLGCMQGCAEGCPSCTFVRDAHCQQPLDEIGCGWLPPNSLLSRAGARLLLAPHD